MITAKQLVDYGRHLLEIRAAYWYGTFGQKASASLYNQKKVQYPGHYTADRASGYKADIAGGKTVVDCIGLIKGAAWSEGGEYSPKYASNGCPDQSADGMFRWCKLKGMKQGKMAALPEEPGLFLHMKGHAGVYIGGGWAIEAKGFTEDVVRTNVAGRGWTGWSYLPFVDYSAGTSVPEPTAARSVEVTGGDTVYVRTTPGTSGAIRGIAYRGDSFEYAGETADNGWHKILYKGSVAWISGKYTTLSDTPEPESEPESEQWDAVIVDLSQHNDLKNRKNDWEKIAKSVDLMILRCGVTRTETEPIGIGQDDHFAYAARKCAEYDIPFGVYYYGKVRTSDDARKEARKAYEVASPFDPLFYCYDVEEGRLSNACLDAFQDELRQLGVTKVGLYVGHNYYERFEESVPLFDFPWIPRYGKNDGTYNPKYAPAFECAIHQYTSRGDGHKLGFYDDTVDLNRLTGALPLSYFTERD